MGKAEKFIFWFIWFLKWKIMISFWRVRHHPSHVSDTLVVILLGDSGTGKSSFLHRLLKNEFHSYWISTIGVDPQLKTLDIDSKKVKGTKISSIIVSPKNSDPVGHSWTRKIQKCGCKLLSVVFSSSDIIFNTLSGANGVFLLYDIADLRSFQQVQSWIKEIEKYGSANPVVMLIGNKVSISSTNIRSTIVWFDELATSSNRRRLRICEWKRICIYGNIC